MFRAFSHDNLIPIQLFAAVTFVHGARGSFNYHKEKVQKSQGYTELRDFHQCNQCSDKKKKKQQQNKISLAWNN